MKPIKDSSNDLGQHQATFTVAGAGTGGGQVIEAIVDGVETTHATVVSQSAATAAAALAAALLVSHPAGYTIASDGAVVSIERDDNARIFADAVSDDAAQTIAADSDTIGRRTTIGATVKLTPAAADGNDGTPCSAEHNGLEGVTLCIMAMLSNGSGGSKTAAYKLRIRRPYLGWIDDSTFGTQTITEATGLAVASKYHEHQVFGADAFAVVLVDDNAGGNLAGTDVHFDAAVQYG